MIRILIILVLAVPLYAATWYAASNGTETNGTYTQPWSVLYSVTNSNPYLSAGDTVIFKSGTYSCVETNADYGLAPCLIFRKSGTIGNPITYKPETLWGFTFDGGVLFQTASNLVFREFVLTYSASTDRDRNTTYTHPGGITDAAPNNHVLHNIISNTGHPGIASWKGTYGKNIAGNIIRFVGVNDYTDTYAGANRGSGMYLQNRDDSSEALIRGNISYYNYTTGMKAYGNTDIWNFRFLNNISAENSEAGIFYHNDNYGSDGVTITNNYIWNGSTGVRIGYTLGNGGHSNAVVVGNYVVETNTHPIYVQDGWSFNTITNNTFIRLNQRYVFYLENSGETSGNTASHTINYNTYFSQNSGGVGANPFVIKETTYTFASWQGQVNGDANSTFTYGTPTGVSSYAFRPSSDINFAHVAVFNWDLASTVNVDLSSLFPTGSRLRIYDAQNIPTAYTNFIYSGGNVSFRLDLTNRAEMLGTFNQRPDTWSGFDSRFRAFVIYRTPSIKLRARTAAP